MLRALLALGVALAAAPTQPRAAPLSYSDLDGWSLDDHRVALATFRRSCGVVASLRPACRAAGSVGGTRDDARAFFERFFVPVPARPDGGDGFLTAYFEPEYRGALAPSAAFPTPLLARPRDLVDEPGGRGLTAARRVAGRLAPYPDRAAIETGALGQRARALVYMDPVEAFVVHVQGSARIRLADGRVLRVAFAGRNGHPYTAIARILSARESIAPSELGLAGLMRWLRNHPDQAPGLMRMNRSYIFFRLNTALRPEEGPIGAANVPLTPGRSLAVDQSAVAYGTPIWLQGELPRPQGGREPLRRLVVAQDTGAAIRGAGRGDLFVGSGEEAGARAGPVREPVRFVVLRPRVP